ncbi:MAG: tRNA1(Val) (adenine(37)-N6)-methyltransferase [Candidatus Binatia bacterium]
MAVMPPRRPNQAMTPARNSDETLDALFDGKLKLFQSRSGHRFSLDALLLAHFATVKRREKVIDLGTGNGIIPLILANLHSQVSITGVELQRGLAERAARNVKLNRLENRIQIRRGDVRAVRFVGAPESFDVVVCNPPYRRPGSGRLSSNDEKQIARHELHGELADFLDAAVFLLNAKGRTALVYLAGRAVDLVSSMRQARLEPKRLRLVHSFSDVAASLVLVEGVKNGRSGIDILPPLIVYRRGTEYSDEMAAMIAGKD